MRKPYLKWSLKALNGRVRGLVVGGFEEWLSCMYHSLQPAKPSRRRKIKKYFDRENINHMGRLSLAFKIKEDSYLLQ